jgi:hypothetical protein
MACGCSGKCSCLILAGQGTSVRGQGTSTSPYVIDSLGTAVTVQDGNDIDMTITGLGTTTSPYVVRADYTGVGAFKETAYYASVAGAFDLRPLDRPTMVRAEVVGFIDDFLLPVWPGAGTIRVLLVPVSVGSGFGFTPAPAGVDYWPVSETGALVLGQAALLEFTWDGIQWGYVRLGTVTGDL